MIQTGGNGSWDTIASLLQGIKPPRMARVRQRFVHPAPVDVACEIKRQFAQMDVLSRVRPGQTVAITVGSRGIANQVLAVRTLVDLLKGAGAEPFIVPAMAAMQALQRRASAICC